MVDIILIRPRYNLASSLYNKVGSRGVKEAYPPLGLLYLKAALQQEGFSVEVIDGLFEDQQSILETIKISSPKLIGIYVVSSTIPEVVGLLKKLSLVTRSPVVLGGPHITHCPESICSFSVEYGVRGDGEESLCLLAKFLFRSQGNLIDIPGLIMCRGKGQLRIPEATRIPDLDRLFFPDFLPANESRYFFPLSTKSMITMIASRGCPFDCVYCGLPNKHSFQTRSISNIIEEIKTNIQKGYGYIDFKDDIFTYDMSRIEDLCSSIIDERIKFDWGCETRVDFLTENLVSLMKTSGCSNIKLGIESSVKSVQQSIGKVISVERIKSSFRMIRRRGMHVVAYFSLGHPGETLFDMKQTVQNITKLSPDYMDVTLCSPIPGSRLFKIAVEEGGFPADYWSKVDNMGLLPVYVPKGVRLEDMRRLQKQAYWQFYFNPKYLIDQLFRIKSFRELFDKAKLACLLYKEACR